MDITEVKQFYLDKNIQWFLEEYYINSNTLPDYATIVLDYRSSLGESDLINFSSVVYGVHNTLITQVLYNVYYEFTRSAYKVYGTGGDPDIIERRISNESLYDPDKNLLCNLNLMQYRASELPPVFAPRISIDKDTIGYILGFISTHILMNLFRVSDVMSLVRSLKREVNSIKIGIASDILAGILGRSQVWIMSSKNFMELENLPNISISSKFVRCKFDEGKEPPIAFMENIGDKEIECRCGSNEIIAFFPEDIESYKVYVHDNIIQNTYDTIENYNKLIKAKQEKVKELEECMVWHYENLPEVLGISFESLQKYSKV